MNEIQYIGEHLLPGQIGRFAIVLAFVASILAAVSYFFAEKNANNADAAGWKRMGRGAFITHGLSIFTVIGILLYIMYNQYYEYQYVQLHVSDDLPMKYIMSAFWEGQEGSFLLWMFWHVVLGFILMRTAKSWEAPVLATLSTVQIFISSMILGAYVFETKIGINPLLMLRDTMDIPLFAQADYVTKLTGNGLNPLLQNYWMTIHPPTLFLGFASTVVPFCYAVAGLWNGRHKEMLQVSLPWALFNGAILGTGILMGGAWAYEALTFGGYWAWDPVENTSLVPWIILVAGIHTHLVAKATGHSIKSTYLFYILAFFFIIFSTFMTRSGILGDTSVHSFTEMGLETQLLIFTSFFLIAPLTLFFAKNKTIPTHKEEEPTASKEFWMFIGSLVLIFSAALITVSTSLPIYNNIKAFLDPTFDIKLQGLVIEDPVNHHNKYQLWIGVFIGLLSGVAQYLRFKELNFGNHASKLFKHLGISTVISLLLTFLASMWINAYAWQYKLLLFTGIFTVVTNLDYFITYIKGNLKVAGSAISHIGFGLMVVGILASGLNKEHISTDPFTHRGLLNEDMIKRNVVLYKGEPLKARDYLMTYETDTMIDKERYYQVNIKRLAKDNSVLESFTVTPNAQFDNRKMKVAAYNPDTKHYLSKDIFTHVATIPKVEADKEEAMKMEDSLNYRPVLLSLGNTIEFSDTMVLKDTTLNNTFLVTLDAFNPEPKVKDYKREEGDIMLGATIQVKHVGNPKKYTANPVILIRDNRIFQFPHQINDLAMKVKLTPEFIEKAFTQDQRLDYKPFQIKEKGSVNFNGYKITFDKFNRSPKHSNYTPEEGDIAVSALLKVEPLSGKGSVGYAEPIYLIRGKRPFNIKDALGNQGLNFRFSSIDPQTGNITLEIAQTNPGENFPVMFATDSNRTDYIVFEAIIFPGINFFWAGSIMMMLGLAMSWIRRRRERKLATA